jgi:uncharacterized protein YacL
MNILDIGIAAAIVDFVTILLSKYFFDMGVSLDKWYKRFGMTAVLSDVLVLVLGVQLALFIEPKAGVFLLLVMAVSIQIVHDILFYFLVIETVPHGQNEMIDLFKEYANENSWKIVVYDSVMIGSTVFLAHTLSKINQTSVNFIGLLTVYALTYIIYTK